MSILYAQSLESGLSNKMMGHDIYTHKQSMTRSDYILHIEGTALSGVTLCLLHFILSSKGSKYISIQEQSLGLLKARFA